MELCEQKFSDTLTVINPLPGWSLKRALTWHPRCAPRVLKMTPAYSHEQDKVTSLLTELAVTVTASPGCTSIMLDGWKKPSLPDTWKLMVTGGWQEGNTLQKPIKEPAHNKPRAHK